MQLVMVGTSHRTAPLKIRESLSITSEQLDGSLGALKQHLGRGVIVATCNRTEIYTIASDTDSGHRGLEEFFEGYFKLPRNQFLEHIYSLHHDKAIRHLYRVASGLDSLILGESEILGQVRDAYGAASRQGMASGVLAHVFHNAIRAGKRARTETAIGKNALSVSRACVELTRHRLGDPSNQRVVVAGVGEASKLAAQALIDAGVSEMTIANRTVSRASELAELLDCQASSLDDIVGLMAGADIVVTSTAAPDYIITTKQVAEALDRRKNKPLLLLDMAIPRDVEPTASEVKGVHLYTIDDLDQIAEANRQRRQFEAVQVETIVEQEVERFRAWWDAQGHVSTIAAMHHQAEIIRSSELQRTFSELTNLTDDQRRKIEAMTVAIVKKLLHSPTEALRERQDESFTRHTRELFNLGET